MGDRLSKSLGRKIQIVACEDDKVNRKILLRIFKQAGLNQDNSDVHLFPDGEVAVSYMTDAAVSKARDFVQEPIRPRDIVRSLVPDLAIFDVIMKRMNGDVTCSALRAAGVSCPIVAMTGMTRDEDIIKLKQDGFTGIVPKPFSKKEIIQLLEDILDSRAVLEQV